MTCILVDVVGEPACSCYINCRPMPPPSDMYSTVFATAHAEAQRREMATLSERVVVSHLPEPQRRGCVRKRSALGGCGTAHLAELMRLLDSFGLQRSRVQTQLHKGMVGSILERIFCNDSDAEMRLAMQSHRLKSCRQQFMAITPR